MKSFAVLGLGRFGRQLSLALSRQGADVLAVDRDRKCVDAVADSVTRAVTANIREIDVLEDLGVAECDCVILACGSDLALAVMTVMNLKNLGVKYLICKVYDEMYKEVVLRLGADQAIIPESEVADKLSAKLTRHHLRDYLVLSDDIAIEERATPKAWVNRTMAEARIRNRYRVNVIAIRRNHTTITTIDANTQMQATDVIVMLGNVGDLRDVMDLE